MWPMEQSEFETPDLAVGPWARQHAPTWSKNYSTYDITQKIHNPELKLFFIVD